MQRRDDPSEPAGLHLPNRKLTVLPALGRQILFGLVLLSAFRSRAQTAAPSPAGPPAPWSVGAQLAFYPRFALAVAPAGQNGPAAGRPWPGLLTVRFRSGPRTALEAGLLGRIEPVRVSSQTTSGGMYLTTTRATAWAVPLLARVRLAPRRAARWQLDAAFGLMPLAATYSEETTFVDARTGQSTTGSSGYLAYRDLPVLAGLGGAYALTPRVGLTADARFAWSFLGTLLVRALSRRTDFVAPVVPALSAGLSYQLGQLAP